MAQKIISGIQQIGIGVKDAYESWKWYNEYFGADAKITAAEGVAERMLPYTGGKPQPRFAILAYNLRGGAGFEIWEPRGRELNYPKADATIGDFGISVGKVKSPDVQAAYDLFKAKGCDLLSGVVTDPGGRKHFFMKDPWNNMWQVEEDAYVFINEPKATGGCNGAILGVSDMDRSVKLYSTVTDFDHIDYDVTDTFEDLAGLPGGQYKMRRVSLSRSKPLEGPLCEVLGTARIELVQRIMDDASVPAPVKLFEGRYWGDPGFIQLCFDVRNMEEVRKVCESLGHKFVCDGGRDFKMGDAGGHFTYIEDPDGTLIEFVETFKINIVKKLGIALSLENRDDRKPLPRIITKALRFLEVDYKKIK